MLKVTLVRSPIGSTQAVRQTLRALGLARPGRTSIVRDNPESQGRIRKVAHLVEVKS